MLVKTVTCKTALVKSKLPGTDYVINPYIGCGFGCLYCYASFMGRFVGHKIQDWGNYVYAKINIDKVLNKEVQKLPNKGRGRIIFLSSVTDPYQGVEAKFQLTRKCLQVLVNNKFQGEVWILTKSFLVIRDIDLLQQLKQTEVGLTITTYNDKVGRFFEVHAPNVSKRLKTLKQLNKAGLETYAFIGPLLPHFVTKVKILDNLLAKISQSGTKKVWVEHLNLSGYIKQRLLTKFRSNSYLIKTFYLSQADDYYQRLNQVVLSLIDKHKLSLMTNQVIWHQKNFRSRSGTENRSGSGKVIGFNFLPGLKAGDSSKVD